jgi:drug/metabolite transporter (DMT)-like permease
VISYRLTSAALGLAIAGAILWLIYKDRLHTRHAVWWSGVALAVMGLGIFPHLVDWLAQRLGIAYPPILGITAAIGVILVKMLVQDLEHSRQERLLRRLIQRVAILEAELKQAARSNERGR